MLISLPIQINGKSTNSLFNLHITDTIITITQHVPPNELISPVNNIIVTSKQYGINTILIYFPFILTIHKLWLVNDLFFLLNTTSSLNNDDFISLLLETIIVTTKKSYKLLNTNVAIILDIFKLNNVVETTDKCDTQYNNVGNMIHRTYNRVNRYLNFCLAILASSDKCNISHNSKILQIINSIKQMKVDFFGNNMTVDEHIEHIVNPHLIKKKRYYFIDNGKKILKLFVTSVNDTIQCGNIKITRDNGIIISAYPQKFMASISISAFIKHITIKNYIDMINIASNILYKKHPINSQLLQSIYCDNIIINKVDLQSKVKEIEPYYEQLLKYSIPNISFATFVDKIVGTELSNNIIEQLFEDYTFPLNYDKKTLTVNFAKILYYSFKFIDNVCGNINNKIKSIYLFILKFYKQLINGSFDIIYNPRIYTDYSLYQIIRILILNDTYNLMTGIKSMNIIKKKFIENIIVLQILYNISLKNISKQITQFKFLINMKQQCSELILVDGKLNKSIINPIMDNRLKKIIIDPLQMFMYLKKEIDYYKWIISFKELCCSIFYNPIILDDKDYIVLSKLLYLLSNQTTQSFDNVNYQQIIEYMQQHSNIILYNDRINIRIKDIFKNNTFNLGYLAKHINDDTEKSITISDVDVNEITQMTRKYYKYKGKYLELKITTPV